MPELKIIINDPELTFCCENTSTRFLKYEDAAGGTSIENQVFVFAHIKNKYVKRAVYVWISKSSKGAWLSDIYSNVKFKIDHGVKRIGNTIYQYCTFFYDNPLRDLKDAVYANGYLLDGVYLNQSVGLLFGPNNNGKYHVDYIESVSEMHEQWDKPDLYNQAQREKIKKFKETANSVFIINY